MDAPFQNAIMVSNQTRNYIEVSMKPKHNPNYAPYSFLGTFFVGPRGTPPPPPPSPHSLTPELASAIRIIRLGVT